MERKKLNIDKEVNAVIKMALNMFESEYLSDDEKLVFYDEKMGIKKAIYEVVPKVVEVAKSFRLSKESMAAIALAVTMNHFLNFAYVPIERGRTAKIIKVMEKLGYKRVKDRYIRRLVDDALRVRWNVAEEFFESNYYDYVIIHIRNKDEVLIFERTEGSE